MWYVRSRIPTIAVLGNHDYESKRQVELMKMMTAPELKFSTVRLTSGMELDSPGTKGFVGGFGRGMLTAFGEAELKTFVQASIDEAIKLERAMAQLRTPKRVVVLHYSPIAATVQGEAAEIFPFLGTSRLAEVVDRHGADLVVHGHAHHGQLEGKTVGGAPVYNVAITLLQGRTPHRLIAFSMSNSYNTNDVPYRCASKPID